MSDQGEEFVFREGTAPTNQEQWDVQQKKEFEEKKVDESEWEAGYEGDSDEKEKGERHVKPVRGGEDPSRTHLQAPDGTWVDVPQGYIVAPDTTVDSRGLLRKSETGELAIWHHRCKAGNHGPCERWTGGPEKFVTEDEVVYIEGAPWCPDCVEKMKEDENRKRIHELFRGNSENN